MTGGNVQRVEPKDLVQRFFNLLNHKLIATNVELKVKLHRGFEFKNENPQELSNDKTMLRRILGNV